MDCWTKLNWLKIGTKMPFSLVRAWTSPKCLFRASLGMGWVGGGPLWAHLNGERESLLWVFILSLSLFYLHSKSFSIYLIFCMQIRKKPQTHKLIFAKPRFYEVLWICSWERERVDFFIFEEFNYFIFLLNSMGIFLLFA